MSGRRVVAALLAMMLGAAVVSILPGATPAAAAGAPSGSAVTVSGPGEFASLKVTVSQTENLINQTVRVSWTGGTPTVGVDQANFLQIMQCWGDDPAGPDRTQCQFGAIPNDPPQARFNVRTRRITNPLDRAETLKPGPDGARQVPFWPVGGQQLKTLVVDSTSEFYDAQVTNEVPVATTRPDGTGRVDFEIETVREAAGLGCGDPVEVNGTTTGRSCWLVIVPRGTKEVDGSTPFGLSSSPFDPTNWDKKIAVHLDFLPQGRPCPIGAPERQVSGHELAADAVSSWQPALCGRGGALYSYTQLSDDVARSQLLQASDPGLALVSNPVSPNQQRPDRPLVYAPVAASGLVFAFDIVANPPGLTDPQDPRQGVAGQPMTEMKLTPRLVAKLLTQSYRGDIPGGGQAVPGGQGVTAQPARLQSNPFGLTNDPEFLKINPEYQGLLPDTLHVDPLVQLGTSDLTGLLWDWVLADPDARAFVAGSPDPSGMVVNETNKGLQPPLDTFPRNDQTCLPVPVPLFNGMYPFCAGDEHPFAIDMHQAGRAASRGDPLGLDPANPAFVNGVVSFPKKPRQPVTTRALIAVVDAATAARYQLPTATLCNAAGEQCAAPDEAGLKAGLDAMKPSAVQGVLQLDPATRPAAAYPLISLSYAATSPRALTEVAGRDYAAFIRYAVGAGQQPGQLPGQLPLGYLPLPDLLHQQALAVATIIETQAGKSTGLPSTPPGASSPTVAAPGLPGSAASNSSSSGGASPNTAPAPAPAPSAVTPPGAASAPVVAQKPVTRARRTPSLPAPAVGALLLTILICGVLAATSSPVLQSPVIHRLGAAVRHRVRRGVRPTER